MLIENNSKSIRRITCPTDFSSESDKVVGYAAQLASSFDAELDVCFYNSNHWWQSEVSPSERIERLKKIISDTVDLRGKDRNELVWSASLIEAHSDPAKTINNFAAMNNSDLIVINSTYRSFPSTSISTVVKQIVRAARCPVLLYPERYFESQERFSAKNDFKQIVIECDFSRESESLLKYGASIAKKLKSQLHLVSVLAPGEASAPELCETSASRKAVKNATCEKLWKMLPKGLDGECKVIAGKKAESPSREIFEYADTIGADLVCTTATIPKLLFESFYPTAVERMVKYASCPVLILNKTTVKPESRQKKTVTLSV
jgi:nucleotide-binding universal stress UspA family protein